MHPALTVAAWPLVYKLPNMQRVDVLRAYVGRRGNRRHKPGRALERTAYRFDVLADYGAFRDLQRHRMLTIEWQPLSTAHGYEVPEPILEAGLGERFEHHHAGEDGEGGEMIGEVFFAQCQVFDGRDQVCRD